MCDVVRRAEFRRTTGAGEGHGPAPGEVIMDGHGVAASRGAYSQLMTKSAGARRYLPSSPFNVPAAAAPPIEVFDVGDRVSHDQFGLGRVIAVEGDAAVLIDFAGRQGRILSPFVKLTKL